MFYIEIQMKQNGRVTDVKLAHHGEGPKSCNELLRLLMKKDFKAFGRSLEGLLLLYNIPGNSETKANVYLALRSLEADLIGLSDRDRNKDKLNAVLHGAVGFVSPRAGGTPMSIEYFASPGQILEETLKPGTPVFGSKLSVTVLGTGNLNLLPISPLFKETQIGDGRVSLFLPVTDDISMRLPACYFITFSDPVPLFMHLYQTIQNITGLPVFGVMQGPIHKLIIYTQNKLCENNEESQFIVSLPDCVDQSYVLHSKVYNDKHVLGILVNKIPFNHPGHVPRILEVLRHMCAYNTLVSSCIRQQRNLNESTDLLHFEVSLQKDFKMCISFQHPGGESLCCVTVKVLSSRKLTCNLYTNALDPSIPCDNEFIMKVMERCMSIPITMRAIFKRAKISNGKMVALSTCDQPALHNPPVVVPPSQPSGDPQMENHSLIHAPYIVGYNKAEGPATAPNPVVQTHGSLEPNYRDVPEFDSVILEEPCLDVTEESHFRNSEKPNSILGEEQNGGLALLPSPITVEQPTYNLLNESASSMADVSSSLTEELSSSVVEELSTSIIEELGISLSGFMVPE
ncbi:mediator of RNA polymerase II transcription subunit 1-like [Discoglossus pictus]